LKRGIFITFEGGDGSGKSTQIRLLQERFREAAQSTLLIREPGSTAIGEKIRDIIVDVENAEMTATTEMLLYAAARAPLVDEVIRPALSEGQIVICDRYLDSSLVYQGVGRQLGETVAAVNAYATLGLLPDLTILLNVDPDRAILRATASGTAADRIESAGDAYHRSVYEAYLNLAAREPDRIVSFDASGSIAEIAADIWQTVSLKLAGMGFAL
jgi:dTMP kinase